MTYRGPTSQGSPLPTSEVSVGDTYKAVDKGTFSDKNLHFLSAKNANTNSIDYEIGDLFIATGVENTSTGYIDAGNIVWSHIPAGDNTDTTYELSTKDTTVTLVNQNLEKDDNPSTISFAVGTENNDLEVSGVSPASKTGVITYSHKKYKEVIVTNNGAGMTLGFGESFTPMVGIEESNGHLTGATSSTFKMPDKPVGKMTVKDDSSAIQLVDSAYQNQDWGTVIFTDDNFVNIDSVGNGTNTLKLSHIAYANPETTVNKTSLQWDEKYPVISSMTNDGKGHISAYTVNNYYMPSNPAIMSITKTSAAAKKTVQSLNKTNGDSNISFTFSTDNDSVDFSGSSDAQVKMNLVWGTF
jgi:hypothetical protein